MSKKTSLNKIGLMQIKKSLNDARFRRLLPPEYQEEITKYLQNPGCPSCGLPLIRKIVRNCRPQLAQFFPNQEVVDEQKVIEKLSENHWSVINCQIDELEDRLRKLSPGRKQIAVSRFEDKVTVVVNELDSIF